MPPGPDSPSPEPHDQANCGQHWKAPTSPDQNAPRPCHLCHKSAFAEDAQGLDSQPSNFRIRYAVVVFRRDPVVEDDEVVASKVQSPFVEDLDIHMGDSTSTPLQVVTQHISSPPPASPHHAHVQSIRLHTWWRC